MSYVHWWYPYPSYPSHYYWPSDVCQCPRCPCCGKRLGYAVWPYGITGTGVFATNGTVGSTASGSATNGCSHG